MFIKFLYFALPFAVAIGLAIGTFKLFVSNIFTIKWIKYSVLLAILAFSLIFFALPTWHYRSEIVYPNGLRAMEDKLIRLTLIHRAVPLIGVVIGILLGQIRGK
jgi:hypothetical protein